MTLAERETRKVFRAVEAEKAMTDYEKAQKAFHENRERLKAERLAREEKAAAHSSEKGVKRRIPQGDNGPSKTGNRPRVG
jgi:hypothetical protein